MLRESSINTEKTIFERVQAPKIRQSLNETVSERKTVLWLWLAGIILRAAVFLLFPNELVASADQVRIIQLARHFAAGDFYGVLDVYWAPLYPLVIGIVASVVDSLIVPAIIVSIVAGSFAVPLTYFLVKQSYGRREAKIAALIAVFYPHLLNSVFALGTENVYLIWIVGALIVGWKGLQKNSPQNFFFAGALLGLGYLTRPEAFAYPAFFALVAAAKSWQQKKLLTRIVWRQIGAVLLGFTIFAAPYLYYLRSATGAWTISAKIEANLAAEGWDETEDSAPPPSNVKEHVYRYVRPFVIALVKIHQSFPNLFPLFLLIFVALGLFGEPWKKKRFEREIYLILFGALTFAGYAATVVQNRYFYILLPILFGWTARGIVRSEKWLRATGQNLLRPSFSRAKFLRLINAKSFVSLCLIAIYLYVLPLNFFVHSRDKAWQTTAYEERDAGLWLKAHSAPAAIVFSASQRPTFYAEREQLTPATTNLAEILNQIKNSKVDYVITSARSLLRHPYLDGLPAILQNSPEFELVYQKNDTPDYEIAIYKLK